MSPKLLLFLFVNNVMWHMGYMITVVDWFDTVLGLINEWKD